MIVHSYMYTELGLIVTSKTATATLELLTTTMLKRTLKKHSRNVLIFRPNRKNFSEKMFFQDLEVSSKILPFVCGGGECNFW